MNGNSFKNRGFTLVEVLIVALALAIIVGVGTGVFVSSIKIQKYNLSHQQIFSQISYITEYMNRAIRMAGEGNGVCIAEGKSYEILGERSGIRFVNYNGDCQEFYLDEAFYLSTGHGRIFSKINEQASVLISSENFDVSLLNFNVIGNSSLDSIQPRVTIFLRMEAIKFSNNQKPSIQIQTTISKRNLDI